MAKLIWGKDLYKGFKLDKNTLLGGAINDILPFQMLTLEEKTIDWIKAVADYYEVVGWNNVERKAHKIQRNYWMRYGKLNPSDYIVNPSVNDYFSSIGMVIPQQHESPLEQFYSLAPSFVDVLRGEFIKRENRWTVEAIDPYSVDEMFSFKRDQFIEIIQQLAVSQYQQSLSNMGLGEGMDEEQLMQQQEEAMQRMQKVEMASKSFRTTGLKWAEKVLQIHEKRYNLAEIEPDAFESLLITDSEFWHIDMLEDDFKVELLNPKYVDYHKGPNVKYVSDGDYFLWFDFMSAGDIVNKFGRRMKEDDILKLKDIYVRTANILVPDYLKSHQGSYYDLSKPWLQATDLNPSMNDAMLGKELVYNFMRTPNFDHNMEVDIFNPVFGKLTTGHPQMFRVMRLYWRSMKRIGWLTKINRDGTIEEPDWVDENYKVTVEPEYDNSVVKEKSKENLLYGEHIDWTWTTEWRHVLKISPNQKHTFWMNSTNTMESIYIDGGPIPFQFKGMNDPFGGLPPVEGAVASYINTGSNSFIDRVYPSQIIYNICMNKVPKNFLNDFGPKIVMDRRMMATNTAGNNVDKVDPVEAYEDKLRESPILDYSLSREALEGLGQPGLPQVADLSTVQYAQFYLNMADQIKWMAAENIGITRQRLGAQKASETAYGVQQGISYSETQTEKYYESHGNIMQRVRQRMLDATQYYTTFKESTKEVYMNSMEENVFLSVEGTENLLKHYNINLVSKANVRKALETISQYLMNDNTLPITPSARLQALVEQSIPKMMSMIRESELEQQYLQEKQQQAELQQRQQEVELQQQLERERIEREALENQLDRESQERIAMIRAMGGLQSDNNMDGQLDAKENMDSIIKQQDMENKMRMNKDTLTAKRQEQIDKMAMEREKNILDLEKEKVKGEYALKVAKENKQKHEKK